jgi:hypothetical protein
MCSNLAAMDKRLQELVNGTLKWVAGTSTLPKCTLQIVATCTSCNLAAILQLTANLLQSQKDDIYKP